MCLCICQPVFVYVSKCSCVCIQMFLCMSISISISIPNSISIPKSIRDTALMHRFSIFVFLDFWDMPSIGNQRFSRFLCIFPNVYVYFSKCLCVFPGPASQPVSSQPASSQQPASQQPASQPAASHPASQPAFRAPVRWALKGPFRGALKEIVVKRPLEVRVKALRP